MSLASGPPETRTAASPHASAGSVPGAAPRLTVADGVATRYPRTQAGAKAAAANFAVAQGSSRLLTDASARKRAIEAMASTPAAPGLLGVANDAAAAASAQLRGDSARLNTKATVARTAVLTEKVMSFDIHSAVIRLWTTSVRGASAGGQSPEAGFSSATVNLAWEGGDWKVSAFSTGKGHVAPISSDQATNPASDFSAYAASEADDPVLSGALTESGLPLPYKHDEQGARSAAVNSVSLHGDPRFFADKAWRHDVLRATTAPSALPGVKREADASADLVVENRQVGHDGRTADGGTLVTRTGVLATRMLSFSPKAASVELWTASVGGVAGDDETQRPQVAYLRMNVNLVWDGGTWKATSVSPSEPLVPSQLPTEQATAAPQFADVGGVADAAALS
ncbi:hypothetical protein [Streptomyces sp. NPDC051561]|uniref:hypothetical protein n=1 Tax=Streptomyces sp. NPDC051561 TaxID=3365658 RepID=UPI00378AADB5